MQGENVRAEEIIAENMVTIAQGLGSKGNLAHPCTIYKLCKDAGVPLREFARTPRIPSLSYITSKRMETIRFPRHQQPQQQEDEEEDEPMPQADGGNFEEEDQQQPQQNQPPQQDHQSQQHEIPSRLHGGGQANKGETRADLPTQPKVHEQVWKEQEKLTKEVQDIRRGQMTQVAAKTQRFEAERNLQLALERQGRDIAEIRRQVNFWNNNVSSKEAYACWAQQ
ncbi:hypothetical protein PIB30_032536 [Stylosanthes scabra]|uniref:Uncharacterized protein n=1 Tax=Stylosanthes scabra TaxID=79078 RepID=A0ABU6YAU8_9FABA|nr:hypothetical protein [Stylosanthes scabra]